MPENPTAVAGLLQAFDHAWSHPWESVTSALEGITTDEATWQAPCYRDEPREDGWPAPGSVWWHVAHLAHCKRYYVRLLDARGQRERPPSEPRPATAGFEHEMSALRDAHSRQRAALAALKDSQLSAPLPNDQTVAEFVAMFTRHDAWHAGQIALARRLWRTRRMS